LTFKEDIADLRNSRVPDILAELAEFGIVPLVHDPQADPAEAAEALGIELVPIEQLVDLDALILAVPHREFRALGADVLAGLLAPGGVLADVKSMLDPEALPSGITYWSL
jgi:UDP-N-acetyl-D-galactosamine dehydrogenase